jgi:hypothetical protein
MPILAVHLATMKIGMLRVVDFPLNVASPLQDVDVITTDMAETILRLAVDSMAAVTLIPDVAQDTRRDKMAHRRCTTYMQTKLLLAAVTTLGGIVDRSSRHQL